MLVKLVAALFISSGFAASAAGTAGATGCMSGGGWGGSGGYCDFNYGPDGSYTHCERVYVLGWGGENCYRVHPGVPQP